jgi:hypothetical protein
MPPAAVYGVHTRVAGKKSKEATPEQNEAFKNPIPIPLRPQCCWALLRRDLTLGSHDFRRSTVALDRAINRSVYLCDARV